MLLEIEKNVWDCIDKMKINTLLYLLTPNFKSFFHFFDGNLLLAQSYKFFHCKPTTSSPGFFIKKNESLPVTLVSGETVIYK